MKSSYLKISCAGLAMVATMMAGTAIGATAEDPQDIQFVVDTGPGGGSDLFARQIVKIAMQNKIIDGNWPVLSQPQGGGLGAMSFLKLKSGHDNFIAAFTSKWVVGSLSMPSAKASIKDLTPIVQLANEQQVIAASSESSYKTFADFIDDAKKNPGKLVQTGGAITSVDYLAALQIEQNVGASWKYLSFDGDGPRITALLRGDAQIMIGALADFSEQVSAGKLRIIGVLGESRATTYPDVPTLKEQGISEEGIPAQLQWRGIAGPPNMSADAIAYYQKIFFEVTKTKDWEDYMAEEGDTTTFVSGDAFKSDVADFTAKMVPLVALLKGATK